VIAGGAFLSYGALSNRASDTETAAAANSPIINIAIKLTTNYDPVFSLLYEVISGLHFHVSTSHISF
jgi:hypothetical protein